jgi:hypothetical protein
LSATGFAASAFASVLRGDGLLGRLRRLGLLGLVGDGHAGHEDEGQQQGKLLHVFRNLLGNGADSPTCGT